MMIIIDYLISFYVPVPIVYFLFSTLGWIVGWSYISIYR